MLVLSFSTTSVWNDFHSKKKRAKYDKMCLFTVYFCPILMKLEFFGQIFEKLSNINLYENPSSGSRVVQCGRTDTTKLIVAFRNFAKTPKIASSKF